MSEHSARADELAAEAGKAMQAALDVTADLSDAAGGWANYVGTGREAADRVMWERVRALQAQAQIHATLALNDTVHVRGL
ncbi:hypothetical protein ACQPZ2_44145 (plasmid) [Nocardia pseudovaccinii]|uniref:hypothetical protein n=1 Tax=Nocardia pseudovaccinii TaxID=189540 RepID=UPI003D94BAEC